MYYKIFSGATLCLCAFSSRSTGAFVFIYATFYYFKRSSMSGTLQMVEFFGYTFLACYIFFLMLGTVSFFSALKFVRYIYDSIKLDWSEALGLWLFGCCKLLLIRFTLYLYTFTEASDQVNSPSFCHVMNYFAQYFFLTIYLIGQCLCRNFVSHLLIMVVCIQ